MFDIEKNLKEIDTLLKKIEAVPVEEGITLFERAVSLSEEALKALSGAQGRLTIIKDRISRLEEDFNLDA
jgi:exonuclease VII small subunit